MTMRTSSLLIFILFVSVSVAQESHTIPFSSRDNVLELKVQNASSTPARALTIRPTDYPQWIEFHPTFQNVGDVLGSEEAISTFLFSLDKTAPVHLPSTIRFMIRNESGEEWTKEITVEVLPPETYELFQNYPNPFNPTTTIPYQLASPSKIRLSIYNILGQEVVRLIDEEQAAGFHRQTWSAVGFASGMYVYELSYADASGKQHSFRKSLMILK